VTFTLPSTTDLDVDTLVVFARVTAAPAGSFAVHSANNSSGTGGSATSAAWTSSSNYNMAWAVGSSGSGSFGSVSASPATNTATAIGTTNSKANWTVASVYDINASDTKTSMTLNLLFKPDVAGSYTILIGSGSNTAGAAVGDYDTINEIAVTSSSKNSTAELAQYLTVTTITVTTAGAPTTATLATYYWSTEVRNGWSPL